MPNCKQLPAAPFFSPGTSSALLLHGVICRSKHPEVVVPTAHQQAVGKRCPGHAEHTLLRHIWPGFDNSPVLHVVAQQTSGQAAQPSLCCPNRMAGPDSGTTTLLNVIAKSKRLHAPCNVNSNFYHGHAKHAAAKAAAGLAAANSLPGEVVDRDRLHRQETATTSVRQPHLLWCIDPQVAASHCKVLAAIVVAGCTAGGLVIWLQLPAWHNRAWPYSLTCRPWTCKLGSHPGVQ